METGTLIKWEVAVGDELEEGDIIAQVETDKATMDMETPSTGFLATIIIPEGTSDLPLGKVYTGTVSCCFFDIIIVIVYLFV